MPCKRRVQRARRRPLDATAVHALLTGNDWFNRPSVDRRDDLEAHWEAHGEQLMVEHEKHHPGEKPWGWWEFEATEQERQCKGFNHYLRIDNRTADEIAAGVRTPPLWPSMDDSRALAAQLLGEQA